MYIVYKNGVAGKKSSYIVLLSAMAIEFFSQKKKNFLNSLTSAILHVNWKVKDTFWWQTSTKGLEMDRRYTGQGLLFSFLTFFCYLSPYTLNSSDSKCAKICNLYLVIDVKTKSMQLISLQDLKNQAAFSAYIIVKKIPLTFEK